MSGTASWLVAIFCALGPDRGTVGVPPVYGPIRAELRASSVPVLLPMPIPQAVGPVRSVALISVGRTGYYVGFSPVARCGGGLSCAFFHVAGYPATARADRSYRQNRALRLPDGRRAFYRPEDCSGAACTEASLVFERRDAIYELDARVACNDLAALESAYRRLRILR